MEITDISQLTKLNIIADKIGVEGGYVDNVNDLGGRTCHGITEGVARQFESQLKSKFDWDGDMRNVTTEMAFYVYEIGYWDPLKLDRVFDACPVLADQMFDLGINAGPGVPVKHLQEYLNVNNRMGTMYDDLVVDGAIGNKTFTALEAYIDKRGKQGRIRLIVAMLSMQASYYIRISSAREKNEEFTYGWIGRVQHHITRYISLIQ